MREERVIRELLQPYLGSLGYTESMLTQQVRTREGQSVDLVVCDQGRPRVVVEIKSGKRFPRDREPKGLRFDPSVRQLQVFATQLGAPYYLLTDGESFLWFTTDDSGRPQLLDDPVRATSVVDTTALRPSGQAILGVLRQLSDLSWRKGLAPGGKVPAVAILAKLQDERGDSRLRQALLAPSNEDSMLLSPLGLSLQDFAQYEYLPEAFEILDTVSLTDAAPEDVLSALDESLFKTRKSHRLRMARWLADFLVRLGQLQHESVVLDIHTAYGNILAAALMPRRGIQPASVWGVGSDSTSALWAKIQQVVLRGEEGDIVTGELPPYDIREARRIPRPTHVIVAPPFGRTRGRKVSSELFPEGITKIEDLYLELAVNWVRRQGRVVMLVPDTLLFASGVSRRTREFVREQTRISGIISLPTGALLPYANVKVSILILVKEPSSRMYEVFLSRVEEFKTKDTFNSLDIPQIAKVLGAFEEWDGTHQISPDSVSWTMPIEALEIDNLTARRYLPLEFSGYEELTSPYPLVALKEVAEVVKRGASIKLDERGHLPVIGPGAIRPMILDTSKIGYTTEVGLPPLPITVQAGDIVLNNIGAHLGSAAVVDEGLAGSYINQHVLLIHPDTARVLPVYLATALNSDYVKPQIERMATGTIMPALSLTRLSDIRIPLADLAIQQRVVTTIEQSRDQLARKREQVKRAEVQFERMIRALFAQAEVEE